VIGDTVADLLTELGLGRDTGASIESLLSDPAQIKALLDSATGAMHDSIMAAVGKAAAAAAGAESGSVGGLPMPVPVLQAPLSAAQSAYSVPEGAVGSVQGVIRRRLIA